MPRISPFPPASLKDALVIAETMCAHNSGNDLRRLTLFGFMKRSPDSNVSRRLITASGGYDLTEGGHSAEIIKLTERGRAIVERNDAQSKLDAVLGIPLFAAFFERYRKGATIPSNQAAIDWIKERGISEASANSCFEIIISNGEYVGLIQEISGTRRIVSPDHALEWLTQQTIGTQVVAPAAPPASLTVPDHQQPVSAPPATPLVQSQSNAQAPSVHIDIQIHIAADAKPDQIEQIFASMAKHLYNKG